MFEKTKLFAVGPMIKPISRPSIIAFHSLSAAFLMLPLVDASRLAIGGMTVGAFLSIEF